MNAPVLTDVLISKSQNATDPNQTKINLRRKKFTPKTVHITTALCPKNAHNTSK